MIPQFANPLPPELDTMQVARFPEKMLMMAVLEDAVYIVREKKRRTCNQRVCYKETLQWFACGGSSDSPFSFLNLCLALDLDPGAVRKACDL